ncbi:MAG TPA: ATP-binding cassette domain-containing protein [Roseiflexaceae bacterium]|nr:ATP-binding cassette domain-containing protein [Roseiflexaceae bacterium]
MVTTVETAPPPETVCSVLPERSVAIEVRGLGKLYRVYERPLDRLVQMLFARFGRTCSHELWALRDVSFTITRGESVGVTGRNGSGKSTLLRMSAGTLTPTGAGAVGGRVAALLDCGSGSHPEFTGRPNVF